MLLSIHLCSYPRLEWDGLVGARWTGGRGSLGRRHGRASLLCRLSGQTCVVEALLSVEACITALHGVSRLTRRFRPPYPIVLRDTCSPPRPSLALGTTGVRLHKNGRPPAFLGRKKVLDITPDGIHFGRRALSRFDFLKDPDARRLRALGGKS